MQFPINRPRIILCELAKSWAKKEMIYNCSIRTQNAWFEDHLNKYKNCDTIVPMVDKNKIAAALKDVTNPHLRRVIQRGYIPSLDLAWVKFLVNLQVFGGIGTWEDICAYSGEDPKYLNKYGWLKFYLFYDMLRVVKRKKGGRIFEISDAGQATIDFATTH